MSPPPLRTDSWSMGRSSQLLRALAPNQVQLSQLATFKTEEIYRAPNNRFYKKLFESRPHLLMTPPRHLGPFSPSGKRGKGKSQCAAQSPPLAMRSRNVRPKDQLKSNSAAAQLPEKQEAVPSERWKRNTRGSRFGHSNQEVANARLRSLVIHCQVQNTTYVLLFFFFLMSKRITFYCSNGNQMDLCKWMLRKIYLSIPLVCIPTYTVLYCSVFSLNVEKY